MAPLDPDHTILFGGNTQNGPSSDTWLHLNGQWKQIVASCDCYGWPKGRSYAAMAQVKPGRIFLYSGQNPSGLLHDAWYLDTESWAWHQDTFGLKGSTPGGIANALVGTLSLQQGQMFLFGGSNALSPALDMAYIFTTGKGWERLPHTSPWPSARRSGSLANLADGQVILFGGLNKDGSVLGDCWALESDQAAWTQLTPALGSAFPSPRQLCAASSYANKAFFLYGGLDGTLNVFADAYIFELTADSTAVNITQFPARMTGPGAMSAGAAAPTKTGALMFGGVSSDDTYSADTYTSSGVDGDWKLEVPHHPLPAARSGASVVSVGDDVLLQGGVSTESAGTTFLNDTWIFSLSNLSLAWRELPATASSPPASSAAIAPIGSRMALLFGGHVPDAAGAVVLSDATYLYNSTSASWTKLEVAHAPSPRVSSMMAQVTEDLAVLFSGSNTTIIEDLWVFNLTSLSWRPLPTTGTHPSPRLAAMFAPASGARLPSAVLYGGKGLTDFADGSTYILSIDVDRWIGVWSIALKAEDGPGLVAFPGYTPTDDGSKILLVAGVAENGKLLSSTWALDVSSLLVKLALAAPETPSTSRRSGTETSLPTNFWSQTPARPNQPAQRREPGVAAFKGTASALLFGGNAPPVSEFNDAYVMTLESSIVTQDGNPHLDGKYPPWMIAILAVGGGLLLALVVVLFVSRRRVRDAEGLPLLGRGRRTADGIEYEHLKFGAVVGRGASGSVYKGFLHGSSVAIKRLHTDVPDERDDWDAEIGMLTTLRHPNVLLYMGFCRHPTLNEIFLVTEFAPLGDLHKVLRDAKRNLNRENLLSICGDAARGLMYLHAKRIIHRDVKSPNLLVFPGPLIKIADFGLSRVLEEPVLQQTSLVGTPCWSAPEVLQYQTYTVQSDIYALGIVMWEVFSGKQPFEEHAVGFQLMSAIIDGTRPDIADIPQELREIVEGCWAPDPAARPSLATVLTCLEGLSIHGLSPKTRSSAVSMMSE